MLHDPTVIASMRARIEKLTPASQRRWGKMSVDQMLWHVNRVLMNGLGQFRPADMFFPLPKPVLRYLGLHIPWPKNTKTPPEFKARDHYSFDAERDRCLALIHEFAERQIDAPGWGHSAGLGDMSGRQWSELQAKHLNHHLRQFGV